MADPTQDERKLRSISIAALTAYLGAHEWSKVDEWPDRATIFARTVGQTERRVWVPVRETFADYADNMERSIGMFAAVEQRSAQDIFVDLKAVASDTVRIAALHDAPQHGLSLHEAGVLLNDSLSLLTAAARSAERCRAAYLGPTSKAVSHFVEGIVPTPTEFSSFDLRLLLPDWTEYGQAQRVADHSFSRRAAMRLADGLQAIQAALEHASSTGDLDMFDAGVSRGVSANLCGAAIRLVEQTQEFSDGMTVDLMWSPLRPHADTSGVRIPISVHSIGTLEAARKHLRARASYLDQPIVGEVVLLEREYHQSLGRVLLLVGVRGSHAPR